MDHGFSLGWHGKWGKGNNYDMETRVPLFVKAPGISKDGKKCEAMVELLDIYPTLVDLCALPDPPQKLEGSSLRPLLADPGAGWKPAAFTTRAYHPKDFGIKTKTHTLISTKEDGIQLFDRKADAFNLQDISLHHPEIVEQLLKLRQEAGM
jgi:iduronate 2-sulfatase